MSKSLILESVDVETISEAIAAVVVAQMGPLIEQASRPLLVGGDEMSRLAGVSRPTLDRLVRADKIPSAKIGSRRLFEPRAVVDALVALGDGSSDVLGAKTTGMSTEASRSAVSEGRA